jgi:hypothetical protein
VIAGPSCTSVERLGEWLEQLLSALSARDPLLERAPSLERATRIGAHEAEREQPHARAGTSEVAFTFNGASLAVHALSSAHPAGHPRHSPASTFAALVLRRPPA